MNSNMDDPEIYCLKFIILGDSTVGKTALINRYVYGDFYENAYNVKKLHFLFQ